MAGRAGLAARVAVVVADPGHGGGQTFLIAALGREVEVVVRAQEDVQAAGVGGIGVEDIPVEAPVEDAGAGGFFL